MKSNKKNSLLTKEKKLLDLLHKNNLFPKRFLIADREGKVFIHSYSNKSMTLGGYIKSFGNVFKSTKSFVNRGKLMNDILKIEFLVSQLIIIERSKKHIDFFDLEDTKKWNTVVDSMTFYEKIKYLRKFGLIDKNIEGKLNEIRNLRNEAAHSLSEKYLEYKGKVVMKTNQFDLFKKDLEDVCNALIDSYNELWEAEDMIDYTIGLIKTKYNKKD